MGLNTSSYQTDSELTELQVQWGGSEGLGAQWELKGIQVGTMEGDSQIARATSFTEFSHNRIIGPPPRPPI